MTAPSQYVWPTARDHAQDAPPPQQPAHVLGRPPEITRPRRTALRRPPSCELLQDCPDRTPCFSAISVQHVVSGHEVSFAAFKVAELRGWPPAAVVDRSRELES